MSAATDRASRRYDRHEDTLAVVDADGRLLGLIPPVGLLRVALEKHAVDLARLGGYLRRTGDARATSEEPVTHRFRHRLPWLALGLAGALLSAGVVGSFERLLEAKILLASFLPGIVYMADAVGTQTETLMIRGLSVGVAVRKVVRLEVLTGLLVGFTLAVAFGVIGLILWDEPGVVLTVALALFAACSVATLVAMGATDAPPTAGLRSRVRQRAARDGRAGSPVDRDLSGPRAGADRVGRARRLVAGR